MASVSSGAVARPSQNIISAGGYRHSMADVAAEFGVSQRTIRRWLADGRIHGRRIGPRLIRFNLDEVRADLLGGDA